MYAIIVVVIGKEGSSMLSANGPYVCTIYHINVQLCCCMTDILSYVGIFWSGGILSRCRRGHLRINVFRLSWRVVVKLILLSHSIATLHLDY